MRGAARGLIVAALLLVVPVSEAAADEWPDFSRSIRELDGGQFLEDEPIWVCDPAAPLPAPGQQGIPSRAHIVGVEEGGRAIDAGTSLAAAFLEPPPRAGELLRSVWIEPRPEIHPLEAGTWAGGGLRAGAYQVRIRGTVLASFRVVAPRASEASVRAALARAARLSQGTREEERVAAARLYEAVFERYPRTSYVTSIYAGLWRLRDHTRTYATAPGAWLETVFAHFHDSCFGTWALDRFMADMPAERSLPLLRKLVGLYPDTRLSRAAARYL